MMCPAHGDETVVSLFAGPGGSCLGAHAHGLRPLGIEWDDACCETRRAAGLPTLQADVAALDPADHAPCVGLIATPPCQAFSMAGKGAGRDHLPEILECLRDLAVGRDSRAEHNATCEDDRAMLVVEPLRWALALRPRWIALEQVPPVLAVWQVIAEPLRDVGYSVWCGVMSSEQFGVPQTRRRAVLVASLDGPVQPPVATHQRYVPGEPAEGTPAGLFGPGLKPWVSMAEALGWEDGPVPSPAPTVTSGGGLTGGVEVFASRAARERAGRSVSRGGEGMNERHGERPDTPDDRPAPTITSKARTATWTYVNGNQENVARRDLDEPAPTVMFGHRSNEVTWQPTHYDRRQQQGQRREDGSRDAVPLVPVERPAPTLGAQGLATGRDVWVHERPAPTVCGDPRGLPEPKHRTGTERQWDNPVRVSVTEAAVLQGFSPDWPWQGSRTAQFRQVGDAWPPAFAAAVIGAALAPSIGARGEAAA